MGLMETSNALSNIQRRKDAKKAVAAAALESQRRDRARKKEAFKAAEAARSTATFEAQMLEQAKLQTEMLARLCEKIGV